MVIAAAAEGFLQTHDAALGEEKKMQICIKSNARFFLMLSSSQAKANPWDSSEGGGGKRKKKEAASRGR